MSQGGQRRDIHGKEERALATSHDPVDAVDDGDDDGGEDEDETMNDER